MSEVAKEVKDVLVTMKCNFYVQNLFYLVLMRGFPHVGYGYLCLCTFCHVLNNSSDWINLKGKDDFF